MKTLDKESELLDRYRRIPVSQIKFIGNFFSCLRVDRLTRSLFFKNSWIDSSAKNELPPDFHSDKHHIMMEMMRIDDSVGRYNKKHVPSAAQRQNDWIKSNCKKEFLTSNPSCTLYFIPNTDDSKRYTYEGYLKNFKNIVLNHSNKVEKYKENYPKCKKTIFFISDESNEFFQAFNKADVEKIQNGKSGIKIIYHQPFRDKKFIEIIKQCKCDYIIWVYWFKNKKYVPNAIIIDVKHYKIKELDYDITLMGKIKEDHICNQHINQ